jgi:lysophospholipase L1-like esterase
MEKLNNCMMRLRIFIVLLCSFTGLSAQDPLRFEKEIQSLIAGDTSVNNRKLILFTGSSSIRFWNSLEQDFPKHNVVNKGFGGSEMKDLLYYAEPLILKHKPKKIFIYEGDNDINAGKTPEEILKTADELLKIIRKRLSKKVEIIFASAKPSLARWQLKEQYQIFNAQLKDWTSKHKRVKFADVWTPMLDDKGEVRTNLFVEDNLHMNQKGYEIWTAVLRKYL